MFPQPSEGQIPILPGLMQSPIPTGLVLIIEIVLVSPTTRAPKPGEGSSDPAEHGRLPLLCPCDALSSLPDARTRRPAALVSSVRGRDRSALGPHRIGNLRIRAGRSGHDGYEEIAGRSLFLPMTSVARPAWRRVRIPPPPPHLPAVPRAGQPGPVPFRRSGGRCGAEASLGRPSAPRARSR
jgi:hypothetical protein